MWTSYNARWRALGDRFLGASPRRSLSALLYQRARSTSSSILLSLLVCATLSLLLSFSAGTLCLSLFLDLSLRLSLWTCLSASLSLDFSLCVCRCLLVFLSPRPSFALLLASTSESATTPLFASASSRLSLGFIGAVDRSRPRLFCSLNVCQRLPAYLWQLHTRWWVAAFTQRDSASAGTFIQRTSTHFFTRPWSLDTEPLVHETADPSTQTAN